jgi:hypothetical protein
MAKVKGALFSMDAAGTIGGALTIRKWKGRQVMAAKGTPSNPKTGAQVGIRANFAGITAAFKALDEITKSYWKAVGDTTQVTALNAMQSRGQKNLAAMMGIQKAPTTSSTDVPAAPSSLVANVSGNKVVLGWTDSVATDAYLVYVHRGTESNFTPSPSNLIQVVANGVETTSDTPGMGTWYYKVKADSEDGILSLPSTGATAVVS